MFAVRHAAERMRGSAVKSRNGTASSASRMSLRALLQTVCGNFLKLWLAF